MTSISFFGKTKSLLPESLAIHILSFITDERRWILVCRSWQDLQAQLTLLPKIMAAIQGMSIFSASPPSPWEVRRLRGGRTNNTYVVKERQVFRRPGEGSEAFIDREAERYNIEQLEGSGLNVTVLEFKEDGSQVTEYIDSAPFSDDLIGKAAEKLRVLHHLKKSFKGTIDPFQRNTDLLKNLKDKQFSLPENLNKQEEAMLRIEACVKEANLSFVPCHNDAQPDNFLYCKRLERLFLIDWEYSANNYLFWDLSYFLFSLENPTPEKERLFLAHYFAEDFSEAQCAWVELFKPLVSWWISLWHWTKLANHSVPETEIAAYTARGHKMYQITLGYLSAPAFSAALESIGSQGPLIGINRP